MPVTIPSTGAGSILPLIATDIVNSENFQIVKLGHSTAGNTGFLGTSTLPMVVVGSATVIGAVANDAADAGNPIKVGGRAVTLLTNNVNSGDRADFVTDIHGRQLSVIAPPDAFRHKSNDYTNPQTGAILWTPASGNQINLTSLRVMTGSSANAGLVTIWFAISGTTIFAVNTHVVPFRGEFAPSNTSRPGAVQAFASPLVGSTNFNLVVTQNSTMQLYVQADGYET